MDEIYRLIGGCAIRLVLGGVVIGLVIAGALWLIF